ncbi:MAG: hypothetical protein COB35_10865 [Gammaproteobacteria bacterium]|nr:MAG: hypothetical protein COB35_10865 [Gammaproteobacteria bacterium]
MLSFEDDEVLSFEDDGVLSFGDDGLGALGDDGLLASKGDVSFFGKARPSMMFLMTISVPPMRISKVRCIT